MEEVWLPVFGLDYGYEVSNLGRVRSTRERIYNLPCRMLSQFPDRNGRWRVTLRGSHGEPKRNYYVHRLVAATFMCPTNGRDQINHIDGNPRNNHLSNLEWCTQLENQQHARQTGLVYQHGGASVRARFTDEQAEEIREMRANGAAYEAIMARFPMAKSTCSYIVNGRTYRGTH